MADSWPLRSRFRDMRAGRWFSLMARAEAAPGIAGSSDVRAPALLHALLELQHDEGAPSKGEEQDEKGGNVYVKGLRLETCVCHGRILVPLAIAVLVT